MQISRRPVGGDIWRNKEEKKSVCFLRQTTGPSVSLERNSTRPPTGGREWEVRDKKKNNKVAPTVGRKKRGKKSGTESIKSLQRKEKRAREEQERSGRFRDWRLKQEGTRRRRRRPTAASCQNLLPQIPPAKLLKHSPPPTQRKKKQTTGGSFSGTDGG